MIILELLKMDGERVWVPEPLITQVREVQKERYDAKVTDTARFLIGLGLRTLAQKREGKEA